MEEADRTRTFIRTIRGVPWLRPAPLRILPLALHGAGVLATQAGECLPLKFFAPVMRLLPQHYTRQQPLVPVKVLSHGPHDAQEAIGSRWRVEVVIDAERQKLRPLRLKNPAPGGLPLPRPKRVVFGHHTLEFHAGIAQLERGNHPVRVDGAHQQGGLAVRAHELKAQDMIFA